MKVLLEKNLDDKVKLSVSLNQDGDVVAAAVIQSDHVLKVVSDAIPGKLDDVVIELLKNQLVKYAKSQ